MKALVAIDAFSYLVRLINIYLYPPLVSILTDGYYCVWCGTLATGLRDRPAKAITPISSAQATARLACSI
jgi:hypothetical protein